MFIKGFNRAWEAERQKIELRLSEDLKKEIDSLNFAITAEKKDDPDYSMELKKMKADLTLRKALVYYESEQIAKQRMQLRISYIAILMSSIALVISILSVLLKIY
jgi:hypothetical protein